MNKLMTLLITIEAIKDNKITLETMVITSQNANSMGDPQIWLNKGEQICVDELIKSITVGNANDACVALAEAVGHSEEEFVGLMNEKATQLGMNNTVFMNSTGIYCAGQHSTAYDMAILAKELLKYKELTPYLTTWMTDVREGQTNLVNLNLLVRNFNGITGMKAASSKEIGYCLVATANRNDLNLICVMLGCQSKDSCFAEAKSIMNYGFNANELFSPDIGEDNLCPLNVNGGEQDKVNIISENTASLVIPRGNSNNIETKVMLDESIQAPVLKGQIVGKVQFYNGETLLLETNIIAESEVKKMTTKIAFKKLLNYLLKF